MAYELWEFGAIGVEELGDRLRAAFTDAERAEQARVAFGGDLSEIGDTVGLDASRDLLGIEHAGTFVIHPPWLSPPPDATAISIDPGHAFGSGSHPSTRLALELLDDELIPAQRVVDLGCGAGALAIGAALRGAQVLAVDIDPAAIDATERNALANGVADRITVVAGSTEQLDGPSDLMAINVTIDIHESLAPTLAVEHARLVVAGLLGADQLARAARAYGAEVVRERADPDGWLAAVLQRS